MKNVVEKVTTQTVAGKKPTGSLGLLELIAIALGGMVGGGIFTVLGIAVDRTGPYAPLAIGLGGVLAALAAYSYVTLGTYYCDEGATYSFIKKTFSTRPFAASVIGWWVIFGYISTISLYAYTFSSYALAGFNLVPEEWFRKLGAGVIIFLFMALNIWSVRGMGKVEDVLVYTKLVILVVISFSLMAKGNTSLPVLLQDSDPVGLLPVAVVLSLTFVAYEGFQLVINAAEEIEQPEIKIPVAIYTAIFLATLIYVVIALGAILAIPLQSIVQNREYALAAGADEVMGYWGSNLVVLGALLATSSAISGTLFGASRQMAVIADDGYLPAFLARRRSGIPVHAIMLMAAMAFLLILVGNLEVILEFGSITFLLVSLLVGIAGFSMRGKTGASGLLTIVAIVGLFFGMLLIIYFQWVNHIEQLYFVATIYTVLTGCAWFYSRRFGLG